MAIDADQKKKIARELARSFGSSTVAVTDGELQQAVQDMDNWIESNQASMLAEFTDPAFATKVPASVVNLSFVLTVMERNGKL